MRFFIFAVLAALAVASPIVEVIERDGSKPNNADVKIEQVQVFGTGCPYGTVEGQIAEDSTLVALTFSSFVASTGTGAKATDARKSCNVRITLKYPPGWSYTVATTTVRGYVQLPRYCSAKLSARYFFSGYADDAECSIPFYGPVDKNYVEQTAVDALVWSRCGAKGKDGPLFNVNTDARVTCDKNAALGVDTQDTKFEMKMHLQWRRC